MSDLISFDPELYGLAYGWPLCDPLNEHGYSTHAVYDRATGKTLGEGFSYQEALNAAGITPPTNAS